MSLSAQKATPILVALLMAQAASGPLAASPMDLSSRTFGVLLGDQTRDQVLLTRDLDGDGSANGAGEAIVWLDLQAVNPSSSAFEIALFDDAAYILDLDETVIWGESAGFGGFIERARTLELIAAPAPPSVLLFGLGLAGLAWRRRAPLTQM